MELTTKKCAHNDQKTVSNIWGQGGGDTQFVFKKNRLFRKTTQNIGKEFKKKELYANYWHII